MSISIQVDEISKKYKLGLTHAGSIRNLINNFYQNLSNRRKKSSTRISKVQAEQVENEYFWALRDISFEVPEGEVFGVIGKNGAGKSTLLKILSKITSPTSGRVKINGRVAALLEVGTGFHPELTGRENVFLNGTVLGMSKNEISRQFDSIVAFAGVDKFIDTPVKRYSSGMKVRLGFAVAAHLEPEILIIDEVLAVGDSEFQKRCLKKMEDVSSSGRTVLFVSHNMSSIKTLTKKSILLSKGEIKRIGPTDEVVNYYLSPSSSVEFTGDVSNLERSFSNLDESIVFEQLKFAGQTSVPELVVNKQLTIEMRLNFVAKVEKFKIGITVFRDDYTPVGSTFSSTIDSCEMNGLCDFIFQFEVESLAPGNYHCALSLTDVSTTNKTVFDSLSDVLLFEVENEFGVDISWKNSWGPIKFPLLKLKTK